MKRYRMKERGAQVLLGVGMAAVLTACGSTAGSDYGIQTPAVETGFLEVKKDTADVQSSYAGSIEGMDNVDIRPQVTGYIETIFVKEGDYVERGQSLFKIKEDVYGEQLNSSSASLQAALAAEANARLEVEKLQPLVEGKVVSDIQLKTAQANYAAAQAQVAQARAAQGSARVNVGFTLIKAPVSGYIGRIPNRMGNLVAPGDATPLTTLSEINNVFVYFSMSEGDFIVFTKQHNTSGMSAGKIELRMADGSLYAYAGQLAPASGHIDRATGSMTMKAIFPNPYKLLRAGGTGRVIIHRTLHDVLKIPKGSVRDIQDRRFVFVLADSNKVKMNPLEIAGTTQANYLVKAGVQAGDKIAIDRIDVLYQDMQVVPVVVPADSLSK